MPHWWLDYLYLETLYGNHLSFPFIHFGLHLPVECDKRSILMKHTVMFGMLLSVPFPILCWRSSYCCPCIAKFSYITLSHAWSFMCTLLSTYLVLFSLYINFRWRTMFGIAAIPSILLALGMAFSPESPRWLFQVSCEIIHWHLIVIFIYYTYLLVFRCEYLPP